MYKLRKIIFIIPFFLASCATIFSGSSQNIAIKIVDSKDNKELQEVSCSITDPYLLLTV